MKNLSKSAIAKLRRVARQIVAEPELYNQFTYGHEENACGRASCIAGWLAWNENPGMFQWEVTHGNVRGVALQALSVETVNDLFDGYGGWWISPFGEQFAEARTKLQRAKVAAARINHFIKTDGAE